MISRNVFYLWLFICFRDFYTLSEYMYDKQKQQQETSKADEKVMIRNWYNRIPYPTPNTKRERNTKN